MASNYDIGLNDADEVVEECVDAIKSGESVGDILEFLQQQFEIDDEDLLKEIVDHIVFLHNNTRQWYLKGYTPVELHQKDNPRVMPFPAKSNNTNVQVGRNDPCPCGSGKKYKKCCGK